MRDKIIFWGLQFVGLILGMAGAIAYIAAIAIICGF